MPDKKLLNLEYSTAQVKTQLNDTTTVASTNHDKYRVMVLGNEILKKFM